jgi:hypothetical protein
MAATAAKSRPKKAPAKKAAAPRKTAAKKPAAKKTAAPRKRAEPKPNAAPAGLAAAGRKLWAEVTAKYSLRPDELRTLEDACAATDMLADFTRAWREMGRPYITKGSMGQDVEHPLIGSIDKQRKARQQFIRQLKLPDDPSSSARPNQQRDAAQSRWAQAHGQSA